MERRSVTSSTIRSIGYESDTRKLEIEFHGGGLYQYSGVAESVYRGLMQASSKGSYFHDQIKDRYPTRRIR